MIDETPFVEIECCQLTKDGQRACGDDFRCERIESENRDIAVLSDGLGSGIKANLLSTMTTTMALEFMKSNKPILRSAEIIMDSLPVCEVRKISYATFTIADMLAGTGRTRMIEMDNPGYIQLRNGMEIPPFATRELVSERWPDRKLKISECQMLLGDRLIFCSDGVTQAGLGTPGCKLGWRREGVLDFARELISADQEISARDLSRAVAFNALAINRDRRCVDDTSCVVIYFRRPRVLRILTGPPYRPEDDATFASLAREPGAKVIICGGTTANIIKRELRTEVEIDLKMIKADDELPPPGRMRGVGLATEGILTLTKVAVALETHGECRAPAAREIISAMEESDEIEFIVGTKVNEAHQDPRLPVDLELRRNIVKRLREVLEKDYRKKVVVHYY